jgi:hypothetical protein
MLHPVARASYKSAPVSPRERPDVEPELGMTLCLPSEAVTSQTSLAALGLGASGEWSGDEPRGTAESTGDDRDCTVRGCRSMWRWRWCWVWCWRFGHFIGDRSEGLKAHREATTRTPPTHHSLPYSPCPTQPHLPDSTTSPMGRTTS